jgi:hypothetical protein|tara:strand:- start:692 stop:1333 length:642 start_codon:yes stop_codon:yes gene_type:complete
VSHPLSPWGGGSDMISLSTQREMTLTAIAERYETEVDKLPQTHFELGGGAARSESGLVYENLIERTCAALDLDARKNDYKKTEEVNGTCLKNLQVDKHIYRNGLMVKAVESKTYLDACYLKRAVMDFIELEQSPEVPDNVDYAIFAGQNACGKDAFAYYQAFFKKITGKEVKIFFVNPSRKRSSSRPIYKEEYREDFKLDKVVYNEFIEWLKK